MVPGFAIKPTLHTPELEFKDPLAYCRQGSVGWFQLKNVEDIAVGLRHMRVVVNHLLVLILKSA